MKRQIVFLLGVCATWATMHATSALATTIHTYGGTVGAIVSANPAEGIDLQNYYGLGWLAVGGRVSVGLVAEFENLNLISGWNNAWTQLTHGPLDWSISNGTDSITSSAAFFNEGGGYFSGQATIFDNSEDGDRFLVNSGGQLSVRPEGYTDYSWYRFEIGLNDHSKSYYNFPANQLTVPFAQPDVASFSSGADAIHDLGPGYGLYDAVLNLRMIVENTDGSTSYGPGLYIGITFDRSTDPDPVPEPTTLLLFGSGLAGLIGARYRKRKGLG
jgi:hypothetical protein